MRAVLFVIYGNSIHVQLVKGKYVIFLIQPVKKLP